MTRRGPRQAIRAARTSAAGRYQDSVGAAGAAVRVGISAGASGVGTIGAEAAGEATWAAAGPAMARRASDSSSAKEMRSIRGIRDTVTTQPGDVKEGSEGYV